ncbi:MAG: hypothetical protein ACRDDA_02625, partial [Aeromonas sp.]
HPCIASSSAAPASLWDLLICAASSQNHTSLRHCSTVILLDEHKSIRFWHSIQKEKSWLVTYGQVTLMLT